MGDTGALDAAEPVVSLDLDGDLLEVDDNSVSAYGWMDGCVEESTVLWIRSRMR